MTDQAMLERVALDPRYVALVRERSRVSWALSGLVVGLYVAFTLVVALDKALLAVPVAGFVATWGIPVGLGLILLAIISIAIYTSLSNRRWDPAMAAILADHAQ